MTVVGTKSKEKVLRRLDGRERHGDDMWQCATVVHFMAHVVMSLNSKAIQ